MVQFLTVKAGDVLYEVTSQKAGNTTMRRQAVFSVRVIEVDDKSALVSWNGNTPTRYSPRHFAKLRRSKPTPKPSIFDRAMAAMQTPPHPETADER